MRFPGICVALTLLLAVAVPAPAGAGGGFDQALFDKWVELSAGSGDPVYWYMKGEVYSHPDGKLIAIMEGVDMRRLSRIEGRTDAIDQLSRKIYIYRDAQTGEILKEYNGNPVTHIRYPYQYMKHQLDGDKLQFYVEQTKEGQLQMIGPEENTIVRHIGETIVFSTPLFLNLETPRGKYEAYENYDFYLHPGEKTGKAKYQLSWNRFADGKAWMGPGKTMMQMVGWRTSDFQELPEVLRSYIETEAPLWKEPPKSLEEIRELQKQK